MKAIRKHRRLDAATRTIALMLTLIMLFTALPVSNALGEDLFRGNAVDSYDSNVSSDGSNDIGGDFNTDVTALHEQDADELAQQTFELTPEDGVTVTLSGLMPVDGYAEAKTASVSEADVLHAYDITIYYRYGKEFEPDEDAPISVSFQSEAIADAIDNKAVSLEAEHIADDGKTESVDLISADNTAPGEATITVTGMGEFSGTALVTFSIKNVLGDVDGNGVVDPFDASIIQRALAGISVDEADRVSALGDVDANGLASIDVTYILRYLSELPVPYPIDEMTDIV